MDTGRLQRSRWDSESLETIQVTTKPCPHCKTRTEKAGGLHHGEIYFIGEGFLLADMCLLSSY